MTSTTTADHTAAPQYNLFCGCSACAGGAEALSFRLAGTIPTSTLVAPQQPPAPATTVIAKVISGDNRIDPLIDDVSFRFNEGSALGTAATVTFSFPSVVPSTYTGEDALDWKPFTDAQKAATRDILSLLQRQIKITFQEVAESPNSSGTMRFGNNTQTVSAGYALLPNSTQTDRDSDTWIANSPDAPVVGNYAWLTLVHEIGHAIGLNHPGNYNAGEAKIADAVGNFLSANEDAYFNSIMSYRQSAQSINDISFMPYDMLALRYLYGKVDFASGDNTYSYTDASGTFVSNIVDDGGTDTLDFSAITAAVDVDLTPGAYSSIGKIASGEKALANLTTSFDATIEKIIGTALSDTMLGNAAINTFTGGGGDDTINGAGGTDVAVYAGARTAFSVSVAAGKITVNGSTGTEGTDTLTSVERLQFLGSGNSLAFDLGTGDAAGKAALFIGLLAPSQIKTPSVVTTILGVFDQGKSLLEVCQLAIDIGLVTSLAGSNTNTALATMAYRNVIGSEPSPAIVDLLVGYMDGRSASFNQATFMSVVAGLDANQTHIGLVGLQQTGLEFI